MSSIDDVAKKANVSKGTVSKVLKNYPNISIKTRKKVLDIVKELNYIPNSNASALSSKKSNKIGVYININDKSQSIDEINMKLLLGSFNAANEFNLDIITIFESNIKHFTFEETVIYFNSLGLAGLVIYGLNKNDKKMHYLINNLNIKTVITDVPIFNNHISCIYVDQTKAQYDVAKELIGKSKGHVLYLAGKKDGYVTDMRNSGIKRFVEENKLTLDIFYAEFNELIAYNVVLKHSDNADFIICASDLMAIGAAKALKKLNINKPISGFDGIKLLGYLDLDIITVEQNFNYEGYKCIEVLKKMIEGTKGKEIIVPHKLVKLTYENILKQS